MVVKFGVVGLGIEEWSIGREHVSCIRKANNAKLTAVCDIARTRAKKYAADFGVKWYTDYEEMIATADIDAISICTPHFLHAPMTLLALRKGKHVLCEKPLATHVKQADEMISTAKKENLKLGVVSVTVFDPIFQEVKDLLEKGRLGRLYRAEVIKSDIRTKAYYETGDWRGTWNQEGGALMINQAIHLIDLLPWYLGRPKEAFGWIANRCHEIQAEDQASALIIFEDNVPAVLQFSNFESPPTDTITICGDQGKVIAKWLHGLRIANYEGSMKELIASSPKPFVQMKYNWIKKDYPKEWSAHFALITDFANAVIEDREPLFKGRDALASLELINGVILSHFKGTKVKFPIDRDEYLDLFQKLKSGKKKLPLARARA